MKVCAFIIPVRFPLAMGNSTFFTTPLPSVTLMVEDTVSVCMLRSLTASRAVDRALVLSLFAESTWFCIALT